MAEAKKKKEKRTVEQGRIYIKATFNNTIVTITDTQGNTIAWSSTGVHGFKGSRKSTPFAARMAADDALKKAVDRGMKSVDVFVKGPGSGRESALRAISAISSSSVLTTSRSIYLDFCATSMLHAMRGLSLRHSGRF